MTAEQAPCPPALAGTLRKERPQGAIPEAAAQPVCTSLWDLLVPAARGSGFNGPCRRNGAESLHGGGCVGPCVWVPLGEGRAHPGWCEALDSALPRPSVPLQPEPKELECDAAVGGEPSPFPGWPFRRGRSACTNSGMGRNQRWRCPLCALGYRTCREGWTRQAPASWHCSIIASAPKLPTSLSHAGSLGKVPQACSSVTLPHLLPFPNSR